MTQWARYLKRLTRGNTQADIAAKIGVDQSTVSRWLRGTSVPDHAATVAFCAQVFGGNVLEAFVAAELLTLEQAGVVPPDQVDFYALVDEDPTLSDQAKIHLKNQYGLLRAASAHARTTEIRTQIEADPELDDETKARLLAHFSDGEGEVTAIYSSTATIVEHPFPRDESD